MADDSTEDEDILMSKGLYRVISKVIGCETEVKLRREGCQLLDLMKNGQGGKYIEATSGSLAEGFMMRTSDLDRMFWSRNIVVVENYSQFIEYHPLYKTILMIDYDYTSPGFALVKCISRDASDQSMTTTCVLKCDELWVSSKLYMEYFLNEYPQTTPHGPCQSYDATGDDIDMANCLKCSFWTQQARSAVSRMRSCGWPSEDIIQEIINDGCLLVPVASKKPLFEGASDFEWRVSLSLAEKRLLHSMNHCQFLCYGLWKLLLSEVIKKIEGMEDLLCSYFLKTVVFWEICRDPTSWTPCNIISKFLQTLRTLICYVNFEYCPNFFIPESNMFFGKVCGEKQKTLMSYLRAFYNEGFLCLLRCPSLQSAFLPFIIDPYLARNLALNDEFYISTNSLSIMRLRHIFAYNPIVRDIRGSVRELDKISQDDTGSDFKLTILAIRKRRLLQNIAERGVHRMLQSTMSWVRNKLRCQIWKSCMTILQQNKTYVCYNRLIISKALYICGDYRRTIYQANVVITKLQNRNTTYDLAVDDDLGNSAQLNVLGLQNFIQKYVATRFELWVETSLYELYPEVQAQTEHIGGVLFHIPPLVLANFLLILSHHRLKEVIQRNDVLRDLSALVHYDDNIHIYPRYRALSWEILGICQQLCGEYPAAYSSYMNALCADPNFFKAATIYRLRSL